VQPIVHLAQTILFTVLIYIKYKLLVQMLICFILLRYHYSDPSHSFIKMLKRLRKLKQRQRKLKILPAWRFICFCRDTLKCVSWSNNSFWFPFIKCWIIILNTSVMLIAVLTHFHKIYFQFGELELFLQSS
jgi:hypothetical protein